MFMDRKDPDSKWRILSERYQDSRGKTEYRHAKSTYVMFNNRHGGFAIKNALRLRELMKEKKDIS